MRISKTRDKKMCRKKAGEEGEQEREKRSARETQRNGKKESDAIETDRK